jgi:hypothetical protein
MGKKKATGSLCSELEEYWGRSAAKKIFHEKQIVFQCILIQSGGQDTIELSPSTPKHFSHLSPSRYLDGVGAAQSCLSGKTTSSINTHSAVWNTRIQNI